VIKPPRPFPRHDGLFGRGYQPLSGPGSLAAVELDLTWCGARLFDRVGEVAVLTEYQLTADEQELVRSRLPVTVRPVFCSRSPRHELPLWMWCGLLAFAFLAGWLACLWGWQ
jgi:hypothetical protein